MKSKRKLRKKIEKLSNQLSELTETINNIEVLTESLFLCSDNPRLPSYRLSSCDIEIANIANRYKKYKWFQSTEDMANEK